MARSSRRQLSFADAELRERAHLDPLLQQISTFLETAVELATAVARDLVAGLKKPERGRHGLNAEQVLRSFILQRIKNLPLRELRERIADGLSIRHFTRFFLDEVPGHDAFQRAFAKITPQTMRLINEAVIKLAIELGLENGAWVRGDTTVTETDIHYPTDSSLLWDSVRVLTRLALGLGEVVPAATKGFVNRQKRAKRLARQIDQLGNSRRQRSVVGKYRALLVVTRLVVRRARGAADAARKAIVDLPDPEQRMVEKLCAEIGTFAGMADKVIAQTTRRVLKGETVPVADKVVSIFEPHTDVIVRGKRRTPAEFGHKVFVAETRNGLVYEHQTLDGNPSDDSNVPRWLDRHIELFGGPPRVMAGDRGFHSAANVALLEQAGVKVECLPHRGGHRSAERTAHEKSRDFRKGLKFRAGIEGRISVLARGRGMKRCRLSGRERFEVYVGAAVLANNLLAIARLLVAKQNAKTARKAA
jgi:IS5 family transposase